jgi:hypothetical protein
METFSCETKEILKVKHSFELPNIEESKVDQVGRRVLTRLAVAV